MSGYAGITSGNSVEPSGFIVVGYGLSVGDCVISGMSGSEISEGGVPGSGAGDSEAGGDSGCGVTTPGVSGCEVVGS